MKFLKFKDVIFEEDTRDSNLIKNEEGGVIGYNQSKCTVRFILEDTEGNEYCWVKENKHIAEALRLICVNEDKKYPNGLGRNMMFNSYYFPLWKKYLTKNNFIANTKDIEFSIFQTQKVDPTIQEFIEKVEKDNENTN